MREGAAAVFREASAAAAAAATAARIVRADRERIIAHTKSFSY